MAHSRSATPFDNIALADAPPVESHPETAAGCIRRFIRVKSRLDELKAEIAALTREADELSERTAELMIDEGMDSPPGVDGMTASFAPVVYVEKRINPETGEPFTTEDVRDALNASGLGSLIQPSYNGSSLRAAMREYAEHGNGIPEPLDRVVALAKRRQLRVTPMAASKRAIAPRSS